MALVNGGVVTAQNVRVGDFLRAWRDDQRGWAWVRVTCLASRPGGLVHIWTEDAEGNAFDAALPAGGRVEIAREIMD